MATPSKPTVEINRNNAQVGVAVTKPSATEALTALALKRGTVEGGPYGTTVVSALASWDDTGAYYTYLNGSLTNDTTYYYIVIATNADGDSDPSDEIAVTPIDTDDDAVILELRILNDGLPALTLVDGQRYRMIAQVLNKATGTSPATWQEDPPGRYRVHPYPLSDPDWSSRRLLLTDGATVAPGAVGVFSAWQTISTGPGQVDIVAQMGQEFISQVGTNYGFGTPTDTITWAVLPAAPAAVDITGGCAEVNLSWTPATGATGTRVYYRDADTDPWSLYITVVGGDSATDNTVTPGVRRQYQLRSYADTGETPEFLCPPVWAASTLPGVVSGLTATAGDDEVALTWTAPSGDVTSYTISRTGDGQDDATFSGVTGTSYTDGTATVNVKWTYTVVAENNCGSSAASASVSAIPYCCLGAWSSGTAPPDTEWTSGGCP